MSGHALLAHACAACRKSNAMGTPGEVHAASCRPPLGRGRRFFCRLLRLAVKRVSGHALLAHACGHLPRKSNAKGTPGEVHAASCRPPLGRGGRFFCRLLRLAVKRVSGHALLAHACRSLPKKQR